MEVRPATRKKLGAVKIGDGFNITDEGVLSVEEKEQFVEFSRERLIELFEQTKARR